MIFFQKWANKFNFTDNNNGFITDYYSYIIQQIITKARKKYRQFENAVFGINILIICNIINIFLSLIILYKV